MTTDILSQPVPPWLLWVTAARADGGVALPPGDAGRTAVIRLDGRRMRTRDAVYEECNRAFALPAYLGRARDVLGEGLAHISWLPAPAYVVVVGRADEVLIDEPPHQLAILARLLCRVAQGWSEPTDLDQSRGRGAVPYHVLLEVPPERWRSTHQRWTSAAADVEMGTLSA